MTSRSALLYDTEAALRLVDGELRALDGGGHAAPDVGPRATPSASPNAPPDAAPAPRPAGLAALPHVLERANAEIQAVLGNLRDSRSAIEAAAVEQLHHTGAKLREVTSTTEGAATDILDALDRAQAYVDALDAADAAGDRAGARCTRDRLREEIFGMVGALQFQDITTQQLAHAGSVLSEMEGRLLQIARMFDPTLAAPAPDAAAPDPRTFDPSATTRDATRRQAMADEIFLVR